MRALWRLLVLLLAAGCTASDEVPPERLPRFVAANGGAPPAVALVLGSGGPRGFAHVGVLKVLEEVGIKPDLVVGSSAGAVVGALYASGMNAAELEDEAYRIKLVRFFELRMLGGGPAKGTTIQEWVNDRVARRPLESLAIPMVVAVTRVRDRTQVLFNHGDTGLAVRVSSATPGRFEPVRIGEDVYFDGDEASPVPIQAARSLGARVVIAVDVSALAESTPPEAPREWVAIDARRARQVALEAPQADVLLHPDIGYYAGHDEAYRYRVMRIAERYTRSQLPAIRAAYARAGLPVPQARVGSTLRIPAAEASR